MALLLLIIFSILYSPLASSTTTPFDKIYAFGDSYTDTGNTRTSTGPAVFNYVSNPPYGSTFFHYPTNRYSNGRIVIDFVAQALSLPFLPPYRDPTADRSHGLCFAVGGATAIRHGFFLKNNVTFDLVPQSLQTQIVWFNKVLASQGCLNMKSTPKDCDAVFRNALIWVGEMGANDYTCSLGSSIPKRTIQNLAIRSVDGFMQVLISKGAKYFVIQGLPPTGCCPYSFSVSAPDDRDIHGCVASMNKQSFRHNTALQALIDRLRRQHPETVMVYADYYNAHLTLLNNGGRYELKERYRACCGYGGGEYNFDVFNTCGTPLSTACKNPNEYLNWDGAHFTEAAYKIMADLFLNGSYCSPPFQYLVNKKLHSS